MPEILVFAEFRDGTLSRVSREVVTAARELADAVGARVEAFVLGSPGAGEQAAELGRFGADLVSAGEADAFSNYSPEGFTAELVAHVQRGDYWAVLFPASALGKDLAPRVAARLGLPLATDATALAVEAGELAITRPMYAGKVFASVTLEASPRLVSLRPNVFLPREFERPGPAVELVDVQPDPASWRARVREVAASGGKQLDVAEASIVVCGGRGMRGPESWGLLEELRDALGEQAALGASRAVVDAGWRPHSEQVGQTGKTVSPQLYFAVGISGAIQHTTGMRAARTIVAVNKNPDAPIFQFANYGIVGDAFEVVPRLTEEIRRIRAAG